MPEADGEVERAPSGALPGSELSLSHLIDRRGRCRLAYEPVADLARGVICGYEALARFPEAMSRERWRAEALERRLEPDLDVFVLRSVLDARESLPDDAFLSFNVHPRTLLRAPVRALLKEAGRLDRLVVELCSPQTAVDEDELVQVGSALRAAGATIAVDDVGAGKGSLRQIAVMRPEFVKLDATLVSGLHCDDAKLAIVDTIGHLASKLDAWIVAQGVSRIEELDALIQLRAPLAQGPLIGVRTKTLTRIGFVLSAYVRDRGVAATEPGALLAFIERPSALELDAGEAQYGAALAQEPELQHMPLVDTQRRPAGMLDRLAFERGEQPSRDVLVVAPSSRIPEVAQRAMLRPPASRLHPVVCCDAQGRYIGVVRIERLVSALALARGHAYAAG